MTDEAKALMERSETIRSQMYLDLVANDTQHKVMLDLIETQAREIERLERLVKYWTARAALAGDSHVAD